MTSQTRNNTTPNATFTFSNSIPVADSTQQSGDGGIITGTVFSHTNQPSAQKTNRKVGVNNVGGNINITREIAAVVRFPTPVPLSVSYPKNWGTQDFGLMQQFLSETISLWGDDDTSSLQATKGTIDSAKSNATQAIKRKVANLSGKDAGAGFLNINQTELLFQGIDFREINLSHTFSPTSEAELTANLQIINIFKKFSAPKLAGPYRLIYPKLFELDFGVSKNGNVKNIFKTKPCALTNITVDYTPDQIWNVFHNGHPVRFKMDLSFKEVELLLEDDFDENDPFNSH